MNRIVIMATLEISGYSLVVYYTIIFTNEFVSTIEWMISGFSLSGIASHSASSGVISASTSSYEVSKNRL